jgi:hypothetical protein
VLSGSPSTLPASGWDSLHVRDGEGMAVQSERLIHRHMAPRGGVRRIKAQIEGECGSTVSGRVRGVSRSSSRELMAAGAWASSPSADPR